MESLRSLPFCLLALVLTACSSKETAVPPADSATDSASDVASETPGDVASFDYCAAETVWTAGCADSGTTGYDPTKCSVRKACFEGKMRPGVGVDLEKCLTTRACFGGDDACYSNAAMPFIDLASVKAYTAACTAKRDACVTAGGATFSSDYCAPMVASYPDAHIAKLQACFGGACADVVKCFQNEMDLIGCGKSMY